VSWRDFTVRKSSIRIEMSYFFLDFSGQMGIIIYINDLTGVVSSALSVKLYCPRGEGNCTIKEYPGYNVEAAA